MVTASELISNKLNRARSYSRFNFDNSKRDENTSDLTPQHALSGMVNASELNQQKTKNPVVVDLTVDVANSERHENTSDLKPQQELLGMVNASELNQQTNKSTKNPVTVDLPIDVTTTKLTETLNVNRVDRQCERGI